MKKDEWWVIKDKSGEIYEHTLRRSRRKAMKARVFISYLPWKHFKSLGDRAVKVRITEVGK